MYGSSTDIDEKAGNGTPPKRYAIVSLIENRQAPTPEELIDLIKAVSRDDVAAHYREHYRARDLVVTVAGAVEHDDVHAGLEIFGPVITVIRADDEDHALHIANDTE